MLVEREKVKEVFDAYVKGYNDEDARIRLKIEHTYRVAALCERIARSLKCTKEEIDLAWLIGMLHDIGRFEQLKNYGTFMDAKSINHAHYGVLLLFEKGLIRQFIASSQYDIVIRKSIENHNIYILPNDLDDYTLHFCNIIRDADKIDILKVNALIPLETVYEFSEEEIKQSIVSNEVLESFYQHQAVKHNLKKTPLDHVVGHISLAFELIFPVSFAIVEEQGYLRQLLNFKPSNEIAIEQFQEIEKEMTNYCKLALELNGLNQ
ncbi:MAG: HD domain-containing protein [Candidatus Galacturonibacter soehngenii]|nr:HD domain-containing protein [Candidatus Galacturonibacter soehngenii]